VGLPHYKNIGCKVLDHFAEVRKMVDIGSNTKREIKDYGLTRYACYLIVQNGDPRKEIIALGQTYFAIQARRQEVAAIISAHLQKNSTVLRIRC
jgi:DNA-damage-inducible protein D